MAGNISTRRYVVIVVCMGLLFDVPLVGLRESNVLGRYGTDSNV